jgi:hypothetical protein
MCRAPSRLCTVRGQALSFASACCTPWRRPSLPAPSSYSGCSADLAGNGGCMLPQRLQSCFGVACQRTCPPRTMLQCRPTLQQRRKQRLLWAARTWTPLLAPAATPTTLAAVGWVACPPAVAGTLDRRGVWPTGTPGPCGCATRSKSAVAQSSRSRGSRGRVVRRAAAQRRCSTVTEESEARPSHRPRPASRRRRWRHGPPGAVARAKRPARAGQTTRVPPASRWQAASARREPRPLPRRLSRTARAIRQPWRTRGSSLGLRLAGTRGRRRRERAVTTP